MIRHTWDGIKCKVCGIEKHTYKESDHKGFKQWRVIYHRSGEIVQNTGCIKIEKPTAQLKLFEECAYIQNS